VILGWVYKTRRLREHIDHASSTKISWWWDYAVKLVIPVVLIFLLVNSIIEELSAPYEGYPVLSLVLLGRDWLIVTLFFAILISMRSWKVVPEERS
jgi:NSS family neurotransmitter:Na+ symporter